jgi:hypothetical protein
MGEIFLTQITADSTQIAADFFGVNCAWKQKRICANLREICVNLRQKTVTET